MAAMVRAAAQNHWAERLHARVAAVISNRADAQGLALTLASLDEMGAVGRIEVDRKSVV